MIDRGLPREYTLLIAGSPHTADYDLIRQLAAHASRVIAIDSGADVANAAGVIPEILIGDLDSVNALTLAALRSEGVEIHAVDSHKDETDLELALAYCARLPEGCSVVVTNVLGGRVDHELVALGALVRVGHLRPLIVERTVTVLFLNKEHASVVLATHGAAPGTVVSVVALEGEAVVSESGMEYNLDHAKLRALDPHGVSNIVRHQDACITVHEGSIAIFINR